jgi:hypothetical protein
MSACGSEAIEWSFAAAATDRFLVAAVNTTIVVLELDPATSAPLATAVPRVLEVSQAVQAVAVMGLRGLNAPFAKDQLVVGGDGKLLQRFSLGAAGAGATPSADGRHTEASWAPVAVYGPHSKRIVHLEEDTLEGSVIIADKFGEVYSVRLDPQSKAEPRGSSEPTFLLQHFSLITAVLVSGMNPHRRIVTCDRDCHIRVSHFPRVYDIETYLWAESPQAMTLSIVELSDGRLCTGDSSGRVHVWSLDPSSGCCPRLLVFDTVRFGQPSSCESGEEARVEFPMAVTSLCSLDCTTLSSSASSTVLICGLHCGSVAVVPLGSSGSGSFLLSPFNGASRGSGALRALAIRRTTANACVALCRDGSLAVIRMLHDGSVQVANFGSQSALTKDLLRGRGGEIDLVSHYASSFAEQNQQSSKRPQDNSSDDEVGDAYPAEDLEAASAQKKKRRGEGEEES